MSDLNPKPSAPALVPLVDEQHPWLGLLPFTERTRRFFFGRDAEIEEILGRIQENTLTILFGQSGLGKTSLLGAGVLPRLVENGCVPLLLRLDFDPAGPTPLEQTRAALRRAMPKAAWPEDADQLTLWELFHRLPLLVPSAADCVPVLLFDQFEEVFTLGHQTSTHERHAEDWLEQLADLLQNRPPKALEDRFGENRSLARGYEFGRCPLRIVFSLREDYLSHLEAWKTRLPLLTQNRMSLHPLNGPQALEAVLGPATLGASPLISREVAGSIVRTVAKVSPETPLACLRAVPPLLSLLCEQLNIARLEGSAEEIDAEMVRQRSGDILQRFYEDSFTLFPQEHREVIRALIEDPPMVTERGYRNSLIREDAEAQLVGAGVAAPKAVFNALVHRRLITAEDHAGLQRLEITHDVLVPLLVRSRKERRDRVAKELAERKLAEEAAKSRKRRLLIGSMALLTLIAAAGAVFGWLATREAKVQRNEALKQTRIAQTEAKRAEDSLSEAKRQANYAKAEAAQAERARADSEKARAVSERQLERSQLEEGRAWLERARTSRGKGDHLTSLMFAGRAVGFAGYGRQDQDSPELKLKYPLLLGKAFIDAEAEKERLQEVKAVAEFVDSVSPTWLPIWSSPVQAHHRGPVTSVGFSPDGTRLASGSGDHTVKLWDAATGKELAILLGHSSDVTSVTFSRNGTRLASGSEDKTVMLWDVASGKAWATLQGHSEKVTSVAFSPDGSRLASGSWDKTVMLWDVASGQKLATLQGHSEKVTSVAFSPDGSRLASGSWDKTVMLWDVASGQKLATLQGHSKKVTSVAFSPDGSRLASGSEDNKVKLWDMASGKELDTLPEHLGDVTSVTFSLNGTLLASGSADKTVKLWDMASGKVLVTLQGHSSEVSSVTFSPDGARLASGSDDKTIKLWDTASGKELAPVQGHRSSVTSVAFSPDGARLVSGSADNTVKLWDAASGKELATLQGHLDIVTCVAFSPDETRLASGSGDHTVKLWDTLRGKELASLEGHLSHVSSVVFSQDGTRLASGSWDNTVKLWDMGSGKELDTLRGHSGDVTSVTFSPDGTLIASGSEDKTVKLWDVASGKEVVPLQGHLKTVTSVTFSPDGTLIASGSEDNTVKLWDVASGKEVAPLQGHSGFVTSVAFSPDGKRLASGSWDETVKLWDVASHKEIATVQGHSSFVASVVFSPDGARMASGSWDKTVKLWDAASDKALVSLMGHLKTVTSMAFSPDGARLASGSGDNTVKLWDTASGKEIASLRGHSNTVTSMAFSPDGTRLASGSYDKTVKLWDLGNGKVLATLGHSEKVISVAFSPDGTRLASGSVDKVAKLWNAANGRELAEKPSFAFRISSASPDGKIKAVLDGDLIRLVPTSAAPDMLALERKGYMTLVGREIAWQTNPSLLSTRAFEPLIWRQDLPAQNAAAEGHASGWIWRLQLCGQGGQWRALPTVWEEARQAGLEHEHAVRHEFAVQAAIAARRLAVQENPQVPQSLWKALLDASRPEDWKDTRFSLPLAQAVPALLANLATPVKLRDGVLAKVLADAPVGWLESVAPLSAKSGR